MTTRDKVMQAAEKILSYETLRSDHLCGDCGRSRGSLDIGKEAFWRQRADERMAQARQAEKGEYSDTRTRILEAGRRMFTRHGYEKASLDLIASDVGLTKGAVYWHFSSKHDLFLAILEHSLQQRACFLLNRAYLHAGRSRSTLQNGSRCSLTVWIRTASARCFSLNSSHPAARPMFVRNCGTCTAA